MIYFDNAATTFPKPESVYDSVQDCMRYYCGNPGRSGHKLSVAASQKIYECRSRIASMFHSDSPEQVVFTYNTTYALNIAIKSMACRGDHILISNLEHNSVLRPVNSLLAHGISYGIYDASYESKEEILRSIKSNIRPNTKIIVAIHSSNISPINLPIEEIGKLCKSRNIAFIVDAAQSAGTYDIDINKCGIDALCAPGHKGLYGPQGCGFILFSDKYKDLIPEMYLKTFIEGGNGINSIERSMPSFIPERFEAGTLSTPAIAGLDAGIRFVKSVGTETIFAHENKLRKRLTYILSNTEGITLYGPKNADGGIVLFNADNFTPSELADELDRSGICVRSGLHCSPLAHKALNTREDGAVRVSFSIFNNLNEVEVFYKKLKYILSK